VYPADKNTCILQEKLHHRTQVSVHQQVQFVIDGIALA